MATLTYCILHTTAYNCILLHRAHLSVSASSSLIACWFGRLSLLRCHRTGPKGHGESTLKLQGTRVKKECGRGPLSTRTTPVRCQS